MLSADWYHEQWPRIPKEELEASSVDFPHQDPDGSQTTTKVLMHKRRVSTQALTGDAPVDVCSVPGLLSLFLKLFPVMLF